MTFMFSMWQVSNNVQSSEDEFLPEDPSPPIMPSSALGAPAAAAIGELKHDF